MTIEWIFWISFATVAYVYLGYPLILAAVRRVRTRPVQKACIEPAVSLIIAAHNERSRIEKKLKNCLELDYPRHKLQIIVSLDGPTDGTECVVEKYTARGVEIVHTPVHRGKPAALNAAMKRACGDIIVFADVRQTFDWRAIRELTANFADKSVGAVSGELLLVGGSDFGTGGSVGVYWRYEKALRSMESDIQSTLGATGAIYAIRRELYRDIPEDTLLDDVLIPMRIVIEGLRTVFEPAAKAYDEPACCPRAEYGRKVRTLAGNYQVITQLPRLLDPWRNPVFFQFVSHKIGRLVVPYALIAMLAANLFLYEGLYLVTLAGQCAWYGAAIVGHVIWKRGVIEPAVSICGRKEAA